MYGLRPVWFPSERMFGLISEQGYAVRHIMEVFDLNLPSTESLVCVIAQLQVSVKPQRKDLEDVIMNN